LRNRVEILGRPTKGKHAIDALEEALAPKGVEMSFKLRGQEGVVRGPFSWDNVDFLILKKSLPVARRQEGSDTAEIRDRGVKRSVHEHQGRSVYGVREVASCSLVMFGGQTVGPAGQATKTGLVTKKAVIARVRKESLDELPVVLGNVSRGER